MPVDQSDPPHLPTGAAEPTSRRRLPAERARLTALLGEIESRIGLKKGALLAAQATGVSEMPASPDAGLAEMIALFKSLDPAGQAVCLSYARALVWSADPSIKAGR